MQQTTIFNTEAVEGVGLHTWMHFTGTSMLRSYNQSCIACSLWSVHPMLPTPEIDIGATTQHLAPHPPCCRTRVVRGCECARCVAHRHHTPWLRLRPRQRVRVSSHLQGTRMVGGGRRDEQRRTAQQRHTHERHVRTQRERHQRVRAPRGGERGHGVVQRGATVVVRALPPDGVPAAQRGEHAQHGAVVAAPCSPRRAHKPRRLSQVVETSHPTECGLSQRRGESRVFSWVTLMLLAHRCRAGAG
jgi:hypothetical protein